MAQSIQNRDGRVERAVERLHVMRPGRLHFSRDTVPGIRWWIPQIALAGLRGDGFMFEFKYFHILLLSFRATSEAVATVMRRIKFIFKARRTNTAWLLKNI